MLKVTVICVGRLKDAFFRDAADEYIKRLKTCCSLEIAEVPAAALPDSPSEKQISAALEKEADALIKKIPPDAYIAAMCVEGKMYSSEDLASCLSRAAMKSGSIAFIIGGSYGLSERVKQMAHERISVSRMTFPHRLFRVMLLEQIYRGFKINAGGRYHK